MRESDSSVWKELASRVIRTTVCDRRIHSVEKELIKITYEARDTAHAADSVLFGDRRFLSDPELRTKLGNVATDR